MLADIITKFLMMILGYAYPAFECFKTVEKNRVQIEELRFWCRYWIIVALMTVLERIGDIFISWVPMYAEMKLAIFIYLWYPKTKGTGFVYETMLRPFVAKHETDIDRGLEEMRSKAWHLAIYYYHNCTDLGQSKFFEMIELLASGRNARANSEKGENNKNNSKGTSPPPPNTFLSFYRLRKKQKQQQSHKKQLPIPSAPTLFTSNHTMSKTLKPDPFQVHFHSQTQFVESMDMPKSEKQNSKPGSTGNAN